MTEELTPEQVIERQFDAYNLKDIDALMATYADEARQFDHPATLVASGADAIRARMAVRFQEPNLKVELIHRSVMGNVVIDHEIVTRTFAEGTGMLEAVAIYEVRAGRIQTASFIAGRKFLD